MLVCNADSAFSNSHVYVDEHGYRYFDHIPVIQVPSRKHLQWHHSCNPREHPNTLFQVRFLRTSLEWNSPWIRESCRDNADHVFEHIMLLYLHAGNCWLHMVVHSVNDDGTFSGHTQ